MGQLLGPGGGAGCPSRKQLEATREGFRVWGLGFRVEALGFRLLVFDCGEV